MTDQTQAPLVLVTGATGAIGPTVVRELHRQGFGVRALVRRQPAPGVLSPGVDWRLGDLTDPASLESALPGVDSVLHLAAFLHVVAPTPAQQELYRLVNVEGTRAVVQAAQQCRVRRVVYFSTIAVYGGNRPGVLTEDAPPQPDTLYAQSKWAGEQMVLAAQNSRGEPLGVVLRLAAVYGPALKGNYRRLLLALASGKFVPLGDGANLRTLVFDQDVARAAVLAACDPAAAGNIYNVTDGQVHTLHSIIEAMCSALGRPYPRVAVPASGVQWALAGLHLLPQRLAVAVRLRNSLEKYRENIAVDGSRIQLSLKFKPAFDLEHGWREVVAALDCTQDAVMATQRTA